MCQRKYSYSYSYSYLLTLTPKTVGEVRSLLGFLGYYRCYVRDFSRRVKLVYDLLSESDASNDKTKGSKNQKNAGKKGQKYESKEVVSWTDEHQNIVR